MKKAVAFILTVGLVIALVGCTLTKGGETSSSAGSFPKEQEKPVPASSQRAEEHGQRGITLTNDQLNQIKEEFLVLVNQERKDEGCGSLTYHPHLEEIAARRAGEIITCFSHERPDGQKWDSLLDDDAYPYEKASENICFTPHAGGGNYSKEAQCVGSRQQIQTAGKAIFECFKNSPPHYSAIIDPDYEHCGIGITYQVTDEEFGIVTFYVAHLFGKQK